MRVMLFTPYLPHQRVGHGGGTAIREMVRQLAKHHELHLVPLLRPNEQELVDPTARDLGCHIHAIPFLDTNASGANQWRLGLTRLWALLRGLAHGYPYYVEKYWSKSLSEQLISIAEEIDPDTIQMEYLQSALLTRDLRKWRDQRLTAGLRAPSLIASTHELGSTPRERKAKRVKNPLSSMILRHQAKAWHHLQRDATRWVDHSLCVTDEDRQQLVKDGGVRCQTIPLGMDTESISPVWEPSTPARCLFVGSFSHAPNCVAVKYLIDNVWSKVANCHSDAVLDIVGRGSIELIQAHGTVPDSIQAHGFVESLDDLYQHSRLFVAPLPEGGGIKIKILEAMAHGIPVVTTPVGAEGIVGPEDRAIWIAPADESFATTILEALDDEDECRARAKRARRIMEERFSWTAIVAQLSELYGAATT
jgi:glycosyltransferase involved in cell wall biosynthesis